MAPVYHNIIITTVHTVYKGVFNFEEDEFWERFMIHAVPLMRYMGQGTEGLKKMWDEIDAKNEGVIVPVQVRWLASLHSIKERWHNGETSALSVVFVVKGSMLVRRLVKEGFNAAGVWYRVEPFTNAGPDSRCKHCWRWGHIENKCCG
jgi:hypothetical protein